MQNRRVAERDANGAKTGRFVRKQVHVKAIVGPAAQKQWLDMVGSICESQRKSTADSLSTIAAEMKVMKAEERAVKRTDTEAVMEQLASTAKRGCRLRDRAPVSP